MYNWSKSSKAYLVLGVLLIFVVYYLSNFSARLEKLSRFLGTSSTIESYIEQVDFFNREQENCRNLIDDWNRVQMSQDYLEKETIFKNAVTLVLDGKEAAEGHTGLVKEKRLTLHHIAKNPNIKTVCETGFNYGHSSFNFLSANPNLKVYSFDLGVHSYVKNMNQTLTDLFSANRFKLTLGSSDRTIPEAIKSGVLPLCDLIFVDGGHTYDVAKSDMVYLASHASPESIILFDDYPTSWGLDFGRAWEESLLAKKLKVNEHLDVAKVKTDIREALAGTKVNHDSIKDLEKTFKVKELLRCRLVNKGSRFDRGFVVGVGIKM